MPIVAPVTMAQLCQEFGAPADMLLSAFYRGGPFVPNTAPNAGVPASGPMSLNQFVGASAGPVQLVHLMGITVFTSGNLGTSTAIVGNDGYAEGQSSGSPGSIMRHMWLLSGAASEYEIYATNQSSTGSVTGTFNTWLSLSASRTWSVRGSTRAGGALTAQLQIRKIGTTEILSTAMISLSSGTPV